MIRAVLDTNVLASAAIAHPGTTLATILDNVVANRFDLGISEYILVELRRTLAPPYYVARITPAAAGVIRPIAYFPGHNRPNYHVRARRRDSS
jgi:predicted nucleic acid-binding protein